MVEHPPYTSSTQLTGLQLGGRAAAAPDRLLWSQGALLGLTLAAAAMTLSFMVARTVLAAPAGVRVRVSITEVLAEAVTGFFGARERVVMVYTLREIRADARPADSVEGRAVFDLSAGTRALDLRPLAMSAAPGSAVRFEARLFALDPVYGDLHLLDVDPARAIADGRAALVGCVTHTLAAADLHTLTLWGGSHQYGRMLPGQCTMGAALPLTASPYRVTYRVDAGRAQ